MAARKKALLPPSLNKVVSKLDVHGNPRPAYEIRQQKARLKATQRWEVQKRKRPRDFGPQAMSGLYGFAADILGDVEAERLMPKGGFPARELADALLNQYPSPDDLIRSRIVRGPGAPEKTTRDRRIALTIDAYIGSTDSVLDRVLKRLAPIWGLSYDRCEKIYKKKKLDEESSKFLRSLYYGYAPKKIEEAIQIYVARK
jgi:hypothetical protein